MSLDEKAEKLSNIKKHYVPKGLEEKLVTHFGYSGPYESGEWDIYTKREVISSRFVAFYGDGRNSLMVEGPYGIILEPVEDDLKTIETALTSSNISRRMLSNTGFALPTSIYGVITVTIPATVLSQTKFGVSPLLSVGLGILSAAITYFGLSSFFRYIRKETCSNLSMYFMNYTIGDDALTKITEEILE